MKTLQVRTFGEYSLSWGDKTISCRGTRKIWSMLAWLLCHRDRPVSTQKLIDLFWGENSDCANPENALRIAIHRVRELLDSLEKGLGKNAVRTRQSACLWSPEVPVELDFIRFEELCLAREPREGRLDRALEALSLYRGEFLGRISSESWVIPLAAHFQNLYLDTAMEAAGLLMERQRWQEAAEICRAAIALEPWHEPLHRLLLESLGAMGDVRGAAAVYENLSRRLFEDFGIRPGEETREIYRRIVRTTEDRMLPMEEILEHLQEPEGDPGAMECDYDHFKMICFAEARAMGRAGRATHVALLSLSPASAGAMSTASCHQVMEQLSLQLRQNLRRGDVISRCSLSQYILMLPGANYENSCMVCRRCIAAFTKAHPRTGVKLQYLVQPLTPNLRVP